MFKGHPRSFETTQVDLFEAADGQAYLSCFPTEGGAAVLIYMTPEAASELRDQLSTYRTVKEAEDEAQVFQQIRSDALARHGA